MRSMRMKVNPVFGVSFLASCFLLISCQYILLRYNVSGTSNVLEFENGSSELEPRRNKKKIEIWGKASIADYLWYHILEGETMTFKDGFFRVGNVNFGDLEFTFRTGPGYIQTTVPQDVSHLIVVMNGRTDEKISHAKQWLEYLPKLPHLKKTAVILLGDEKCENDWILPYLRSKGGLVNVLFIVYDSPLVDNREIFQWPLGVAVYRGFPNVPPTSVELSGQRHFKCNFVGTVYENSSRRTLVNILESSQFHYNCYLAPRQKWLPKESKTSLMKYSAILSDSDVTLSPIGKNAECYRIYEAMSFGSIPVVEDTVAEGQCVAPYRLLKKYKAPIMYIKNWLDLDSLFRQEGNITQEEITERRRTIVHWYKNFKADMAKTFAKIVSKNFF